MELGLVGCLLTKMPAPTHGFYRSNSAIDCFCIAKVWKAFRLVCGHHKSRPLFFLKQGCAFSRFSGLPVLGRSTMIVTGVIAIHPTTGCHHCKRSLGSARFSDHLTVVLARSSASLPVSRPVIAVPPHPYSLVKEPMKGGCKLAFHLMSKNKGGVGVFS